MPQPTCANSCAQAPSVTARRTPRAYSSSAATPRLAALDRFAEHADRSGDLQGDQHDKVKPKMIIALILGLALQRTCNRNRRCFPATRARRRCVLRSRSPSTSVLPLLAVMPASRRVAGPATGGKTTSERGRAACCWSVVSGNPGGSLLVTGVANPSTYSSIAASLAHTPPPGRARHRLLDVGFRNASLAS